MSQRTRPTRCDFVLHMAHAYQASSAPQRQDKSRDAITRMGPPIFAAALTTAATGAVMYGCTILFFLRFGTILLLTMVYAILTAVFFFLALTNAAGPQGHFGSLAPVCAPLFRSKPSGKAVESAPPTSLRSTSTGTSTSSGSLKQPGEAAEMAA